jgi:hypothetical protein
MDPCGALAVNGECEEHQACCALYNRSAVHSRDPDCVYELATIAMAYVCNYALLV